MLKGLLLLFVVALSVAEDYEELGEVKEYLERFGYMGEKSGDEEIEEMVDEDDVMRAALSNFQAMAGINITGDIDSETSRFMRMPRCGVVDSSHKASYVRRRKRYAAEGIKWKKNHLTYRFNSFTADINHNRVSLIFKEAFNAWQENSGLTFTEVLHPKPADIMISFVSRGHGDGNPFDGPGKVLAHAYFPGSGIGGDAHFDEDEHWTDKTREGTNLLQVAIHELGHSLGLGHSKVKGAIMQAFYQGYKPFQTLHYDDVAGIQSLYGRPKKKNTPRPPDPAPRTTTPKKPDVTPHYHLCQLNKIDSIASAEDRILVFAGTKFFVFEGYGHDIKNVEWYDNKKMFLNIGNQPPNIAITHPSSELKGHLWMHSEGKVWKYAYNFRKGTVPHNYVSLMGGYPKRQTREVNRFPEGITAGFRWKENGNEYYFKGNKYYRRQPSFGWIDRNYPKKLKIWRGVPEGVDGVFSYSPSDPEKAGTFFFKGNKVYFYNVEMDRVDPHFPSQLSFFFGCEAPKSDKLEDWKNSSNIPNPNLMLLLLSATSCLTTLFLSGVVAV